MSERMNCKRVKNKEVPHKAQMDCYKTIFLRLGERVLYIRK